MVMKAQLTKTSFKAQALEHFRRVQATKRPLVIMERGKPVLKIIPYSDDFENDLAPFRGLLLRYDNPTAPVGGEDWSLS